MTKRITPSKHLSRPAHLPVESDVLRDLLVLAAEHGLDPQALLDRAQVGVSAEKVLEGSWRSSISHADFARFYAQCVWALDQQSSHQERRAPIRKLEFDLLCHCLITCRDLRGAMARLFDFSAMLHPRMGQQRLVMQGTRAVFIMDSLRAVRNEAAYLTDLTGLSSLRRLFGWLIGERLELAYVEMCYPPHLEEKTLSHLMPYPVRHRAPHNALVFDADFLDRPIRRTPAELEQWLSHFPFDVTQPQSKDAPITETVEAMIRSALERGAPTPSGRTMAAQLSISVGTLNRRLAAEGTSLRSAKQHCRIALAEVLLGDPRLSIGEIARRTGYSDYTALSRAFRAARGTSPSAWRDTSNNV